MQVKVLLLLLLGCLGKSNVDHTAVDFVKTLFATRGDYEEFITVLYSLQEMSSENVYLDYGDAKSEFNNNTNNSKNRMDRKMTTALFPEQSSSFRRYKIGWKRGHTRSELPTWALRVAGP